MYYEFDHLVGHFEYYDPNEWTNNELGVPGDEDGLAPTIPNPRTTQIPGAAPRTWNFSPYYLEHRYGEGETGAFKL